MSSRKTKAHARPAPLIVPKTPWTQRPLWIALTYLFGLLPICLLWNGNNAFYFDWNNHLWEIGYFGEYFRRHGTFPVVLNTEQVAGIPYPVFYGYLFYPAAGLISAFTGCSFALRLICSLVFLFQVRQVSKTVHTLTGNRFVAFAVTILVSFATYPLTNLYNRTAIPEFIAASLIISVCMMWLRIVRMEDPDRRRTLLFGAALTLAFAMGTHPITAVLGGSMVCLLILASIPFAIHSRDLWKSLGVAAPLLFIVMAPWVYVVARYGNKINLTGGWIVLFTKSIDRWITRFSPIPWDPRRGTPELAKWGTPNLDAQINFAMLVFAFYLLYRATRRSDAKPIREVRIAGAALAGFVLACVMSLSPFFWRMVPNALKFIQFSYRLVTYADLFLLLAVLFLLAGMRRIVRSPDRPLMAVLTLCLALSTVSLAVKLIHAHEVEIPNTLAGSGWPTTNRDALRSLPPTFYGVQGYAVKSGSRGILPGVPASPQVLFTVGMQQHFGEVSPISVPAGASGILVTNVQIFPWNRIVWKGREIPFAETGANSDMLTVIDRKPEAGTLEYVFRPDPIWMVLRILSLWTFVLWAAALPVWYYFTGNRKGSASTPSGFRT